MEVGIWNINAKPEKVSFFRLESESRLEDILCRDICMVTGISA